MRRHSLLYTLLVSSPAICSAHSVVAHTATAPVQAATVQAATVQLGPQYDPITGQLTIPGLTLSSGLSGVCFDVVLKTVTTSPTIRLEVVSATSGTCPSAPSTTTPTTTTPTTTPTTTTPTTTTPTTTTPTTTTSSASSLYTLDTCTSTFAAGVPAFYKNFFRCVDVSMSGTDVVVKTKSLPPHKSYYWGTSSPNYTPFDTSRGMQYRANPSTLGQENVTLTIPSSPVSKNLTITSSMVDKVAGTSTSEYRGSPQGVALDGVQLFHGVAAPGDNIDNEAYTFDNYNAHPAGISYHYHSGSPGPLEVLQKLGVVTTSTQGAAEVELFGMMCDGTVMMGCKELDGSSVNTATLDAQNGHLGDIKGADGTVYFTNRYHVHACPSKWTGALARPYTPEIQYYSSCNVVK